MNLSDAFQLISSYTNPVKIAASCMGWTIGAFLVFLLLVILLRKVILVKRQYLFLRILAWTYVIFLPIVAGFFGFKYGFISGVQNDLKAHAAAYTAKMNALVNQSFGESADEFFLEVTTGRDSVDHELTYDRALDNFAETIYARFGSAIENSAAQKDAGGKIFALLLRVTKSKGISFGMKYAIHEALEKSLGIEKGTSKEIMRTKFDALLQHGICTTVMEIQVDRFFNPMKRSVLLLFGLVLLFPVAECSVSNYVHRKKMKNAQPVPETVPSTVR